LQPNLVPPLTLPSQTIAYAKELALVAPGLHILPSLYLTSNLTPAHIREAKEGGIVGVKSYPRGVTTNSEGGVGMEGYAVYDEVFAEMEKVDMVLNLHGEVPSDVDGDVRFFAFLSSPFLAFSSQQLIRLRPSTGNLRPERRGALHPSPSRDQPQVPQASHRSRALHHRRRCRSRTSPSLFPLFFTSSSPSPLYDRY
jgi:hypothetical protein